MVPIDAILGELAMDLLSDKASCCCGGVIGLEFQLIVRSEI